MTTVKTAEQYVLRGCDDHRPRHTDTTTKMVTSWAITDGPHNMLC